MVCGVGRGGGSVIFFDGGGVNEVECAVRFNDFFPSGGEFDFRCFDVIESVEELDNSFPILLQAWAINTNGFSFFGEYWSIYIKD